MTAIQPSLQWRPNPTGKQNFIIEAAADQIADAGDILAQLSLDMRRRFVFDDTDIATIASRIDGAKKALAKAETELASPTSKVRQESPVRDATFIEGGVLS